MGKLTDVALQALVRRGLPFRGKSDGGGLTFSISKAGAAIWKLRYRLNGKPRWMTLGRYEEGGMSLKQARIRADKERSRVAEGVA